MTAPTIPSTGDPSLDLAIDMLLRPDTTRATRDWLRATLAESLRDKPSRLDVK